MQITKRRLIFFLCPVLDLQPSFKRLEVGKEGMPPLFLEYLVLEGSPVLFMIRLGRRRAGACPPSQPLTVRTVTLLYRSHELRTTSPFNLHAIIFNNRI